MYLVQMPSILVYRDCILLHNVSRHTIRKEHLSAKWQRMCNENVDVRLVIESISNGESVSVSRGQIFQTNEPFNKLIKALWWGYPNGMRVSRYFSNIISKAGVISTLLAQYGDRNITEDEYIRLYYQVKSTVGQGIGMSTISKFFYFFKISVEGCKSVIVDSKVKKAMNYFDDFNPIHESGEAIGYLSATREINRVAGEWAEPGQIEYFLFGFQEY